MSNIYNIHNGLEVYGNVTAVTYYGDGSKLSGITNTYTTGATLNDSTITFDRNDSISYNVNLSGISNLSNYYNSAQTNANYLSANTYYFPQLSATTLSAGTFLITTTPQTTTGKTSVLVRNDDGLIKTVDISSLASGFLLGSGMTLVGTSSGTAVEMPVLYNNYLFSVSNIASNGVLPFTIPAGYMIDSIVFIETTGSSAGNVSISTTSGYTGDVIAELTLDANQILNTGPNSDAKIFSFVTSQSLYISSDAWGSGVVSLKVLLKNLNE